MRILFLQKVDNARGGVINVNLGLMNYFLKNGYEVQVVSIRHGYTWETINYPDSVKKIVINESEIWGCPLLSEVLACFKKGQLLKCIDTLVSRLKYKNRISQDYDQCKKEIMRLKPDIIINSHYEVLAGIPKEYLNRTIMHFHTNYNQVRENRSYINTFNKYKNQIACFVWLSKKTYESAVKDGFLNSRYIYNALPFKQDKCANAEAKKIVFVGRIAKEKRVWLAIDHFLKAIEKPEFKDWIFEIYGDGDDVDQIKSLIDQHDRIIYKGVTNNVQEVFLSSSLMIMTSSFEGMPLVVLEANECGVPVIAYDFGESSQEVIIHEKTGLIIEQDDSRLFQKELERLMSDVNYRSYLADNAKSFAKHFAMDEIGPIWLKLFDEICQKYNLQQS